jgi:hypothetical protein
VAASGVYLIIMAGWVLWDRAYGTNGGAGPGLSYPLANGLATAAERRLAEAYFSPTGLMHAESDKAAEGYSYSQELRAVLRKLLMEHPATWKSATFFTPPSLFASYANDPHGVEQSKALLQIAYGMIDEAMKTKIWAMGDAFSMADCAAAPAFVAEVPPVTQPPHAKPMIIVATAPPTAPHTAGFTWAGTFTEIFFCAASFLFTRMCGFMLHVWH